MNKEQILNNDIFNNPNMNPIFIVEAGSRAWGIESSDSDYDVRFIYTHSNPEAYVSLDEPQQHVQHMSDDNMLDIAGWDIRKALGLIRKGNASVYEWVNSPIIYHTTLRPMQALDLLSLSSSNLCGLTHHHIGLAEGHVRKFIAGNPTPRLKHVLYAMRSYLSAKFMIEHRKPYPVNCWTLESVVEDIEFLDLLVKKTTSVESDTAPANSFNGLLNADFKQMHAQAYSLPSTVDMEHLTLFYRTMIGYV